MNGRIADLESTLAHWQAQIAEAGSVIDGLARSSTYLRLKAASRAGGLQGDSQKVAAEVVATVDTLWGRYLLLSQLLAEADELCRSVGFIGGEEKIARALTLLEGESIALPEAALPLAQQRLTRSAAIRMSPKVLLADMEADFARARDHVLAIEAGWAVAERLEQRRIELTALMDEARALGCPVPATLAEIKPAIAKAEVLVEADPLGASEADAKIGTLLMRANQSLAGPRADAAAAHAFMEKAVPALARLAALYAETVAARDVRLRVIADTPEAPLPSDPAADLGAWLFTLSKTLETGQVRASRVGGERWSKSFLAAEASLTALRDTDHRLVAAREELRGRCAALSGKMAVRRAQNRLSPEAVNLMSHAERLLFSGGTPLKEAAEAVQALEIALRWEVKS